MSAAIAALRALIVDDEVVARRGLARQLAALPGVVIAGEYRRLSR